MIKLYNGDCLEVMDKLIEQGVKVDAIITSPPYNIGKEYETKQPLNDYLKWQEKCIEKYEKILSKNGVLMLNVGCFVFKNGDSLPLSFEFYSLLKKYNFKIRQNIIWNFSSGLSATKKLSGRYEDIMWCYKGEDLPVFNLESVRIKEWKAFDKRNNPNGKNPTNVWNIEQVKGNSKEKTKHPCQFPEVLINRIINGMTNESQVILDPFMGSGTTGVACVNTNRNFIGIELDKAYFDIAKERIEKAQLEVHSD